MNKFKDNTLVWVKKEYGSSKVYRVMGSLNDGIAAEIMLISLHVGYSGSCLGINPDRWNEFYI